MNPHRIAMCILLTVLLGGAIFIYIKASHTISLFGLLFICTTMLIMLIYHWRHRKEPTKGEEVAGAVIGGMS